MGAGLRHCCQSFKGGVPTPIENARQLPQKAGAVKAEFWTPPLRIFGNARNAPRKPASRSAFPAMRASAQIPALNNLFRRIIGVVLPKLFLCFGLTLGAKCGQTIRAPKVAAIECRRLRPASTISEWHKELGPVALSNVITAGLAVGGGGRGRALSAKAKRPVALVAVTHFFFGSHGRGGQSHSDFESASNQTKNLATSRASLGCGARMMDRERARWFMARSWHRRLPAPSGRRS